MLFLSFFSLPLSLEPACTLPSLLFLTWPEYPAIYLGLPSDSTRFALDQKKKMGKSLHQNSRLDEI